MKFRFIFALTLLLIIFSGNAYADEFNGAADSNRTTRRFVLNSGLSTTSGFPNLDINYNIADRFSLGFGLGYSLNGNSSLLASSIIMKLNCKLYLYDFNPNVSFYTQTDAGIETGDKVIDSGGLFNSRPSIVSHTDYIFAQKIGLELRGNSALTFNAAWGFLYWTADDTNAPFLANMFKNSFVPFAIDLLLGYSF